MDSSNSSDIGGATYRPSIPWTSPPVGYHGETRELLWKVVTPIIITSGTFGNLLTILVLMRRTKIMCPTTMYLLVLAVTNLMFLWCEPLRNWIKHVWDIDLRYLSDIGCKTHLYLTYASLQFSSWMLVAVTLERTVSVLSPHKVKIYCTRRAATLVICCMFLFIFGINIVIPVINGTDGYQPLKGQGHINCTPKTKAYIEFTDNVWQWIDFSLKFAIPFVFLVAGNALIIGQLHRSKSLRGNLQGNSESGRPMSRSVRTAVAIGVRTTSLCTIFFITMMPVSVLQIYYPYRYEDKTNMVDEDSSAAREAYQYFLFQHSIVNLVSYTNASLNVVIYMFGSSKFRAELKSMLCGLTKRKKSLISSFASHGIMKSTYSQSNHSRTTHTRSSSQLTDALLKLSVKSKPKSTKSDKSKVKKCRRRVTFSETVSHRQLDISGTDCIDNVSISSISSMLSRYNILRKPVQVNNEQDSVSIESDYDVNYPEIIGNFAEKMLTKDILKVFEKGESKELNGFYLEL